MLWPLQFGTKFTEMDALSGRHQTTRGIWLARSPKLQSQVTRRSSCQTHTPRRKAPDNYEAHEAYITPCRGDFQSAICMQALIMDLEGSDGRERGEDDTSFERQSALFALSAADVLLVNMWAKVGVASHPVQACRVLCNCRCTSSKL